MTYPLSGRKRKNASLSDRFAKVAGIGAAAVALFGSIIAIQVFAERGLSDQPYAGQAVVDAGYSQPVYQGLARRRDCNEGEIYRDKFTAVNVQNRNVSLVVCRSYTGNTSNVRVLQNHRR